MFLRKNSKRCPICLHELVYDSSKQYFLDSIWAPTYMQLKTYWRPKFSKSNFRFSLHDNFKGRRPTTRIDFMTTKDRPNNSRKYNVCVRVLCTKCMYACFESITNINDMLRYKSTCS